MAVEEKKEEKVEEKKEEKVEVKLGPSGLDAFTADQLKDLYKKSPQMFAEAGIVKPEPKGEEKKPEPSKSAAPLMMAETEIKLPEDLELNRDEIAKRIAVAVEVGMNAKQFQRQLDYEVDVARRQLAAMPKPKTAEEIAQEQDAANVSVLKKEWGSKYDENMELARRAALKHSTPEFLSNEKLRVTDPATVKFLAKLGQADAEDHTPGGGQPRNGEEKKDAAQDQNSKLKRLYNHPTSQGMFKEE